METLITPFEEMDFSGENANDIYVDDVSVTYCQSSDCTEDEEDVQTITISSRNNGMGRFINLKTENWSIDGIEELEKILKDFCNRAGIKKEEKDGEN